MESATAPLTIKSASNSPPDCPINSSISPTPKHSHTHSSQISSPMIPDDVSFQECDEMGLQKLLVSRIPLCYFLAYHIDTFAPENLFFLLDVIIFQIHPAVIFDTYLAPRSPLELNLPEPNRLAALKAWAESDPVACFESVRHGVMTMLEESWLHYKKLREWTSHDECGISKVIGVLNKRFPYTPCPSVCSSTGSCTSEDDQPTTPNALVRRKTIYFIEYCCHGSVPPHFALLLKELSRPHHKMKTRIASRLSTSSSSKRAPGTSSTGLPFECPVNQAKVGTFLKLSKHGTLLAAWFKDGNNSTRIIGIALVSCENQANWTWFLQFLHSKLTSLPYFVMSDQEMGLVNAVSEVFGSEVHHSHCFCHILANMLKYVRSRGLYKASWILAKCVSLEQFSAAESSIKSINPEAHSWLERIGYS